MMVRCTRGRAAVRLGAPEAGLQLDYYKPRSPPLQVPHRRCAVDEAWIDMRVRVGAWISGSIRIRMPARVGVGVSGGAWIHQPANPTR